MGPENVRRLKGLPGLTRGHWEGLAKCPCCRPGSDRNSLEVWQCANLPDSPGEGLYATLLAFRLGMAKEQGNLIGKGLSSCRLRAT
jgi:hypothetical protein